MHKKLSQLFVVVDATERLKVLLRELRINLIISHLKKLQNLWWMNCFYMSTSAGQVGLTMASY